MQKNFVRANVPTIYVVFGATGDLTRRKLLPSLASLAALGELPDRFAIVGFAGTTHTDESFRAYAREILTAAGAESVVIDRLIARTFYVAGQFADATAYQTLAHKIIEVERAIGQCTNKLFHLAVPPVHYPVLLTNLAHSGLTIPCSDATGWTRVLVEKPFGRDLATATELDILLGRLFREEQIFRIDHYLAKETIQNILTFRFANMLFEPIWHKDAIDRVEITLHETLDVGTRGTFYDGIGALRDVGQNHMIQMLALVAMDHPGEFSSAAIRAGRAAVLARTRLMDGDDAVVRAQYAGYRDAAGVDAASTTETFFRLRMAIDSPRWQGVPFILESGKALERQETAIRVFFRDVVPCFCGQEHPSGRHPNILTFRIQPEEGIAMQFYAKQPGLGYAVEPRLLAFDYAHPGQAPGPDAYATVIFDCIRGSQTLFAATDEMTESWRIVTPILQDWQGTPLPSYAPGSDPDDIGATL